MRTASSERCRRTVRDLQVGESVRRARACCPCKLQESRGREDLAHVCTLQLGEEPSVNLRELEHLLHGVAALKSRGDRKDALMVGILELRLKVFLADVAQPCWRLKARQRRVYHADGLLERLLKGPSDRHDLADGLHGRANLLGDPVKLSGQTRNL